MNMRSFCGSEGEGSKGRYVENPFVLIGLGIKIFFRVLYFKNFGVTFFRTTKKLLFSAKKVCVCVRDRVRVCL